MVRFHYPEPVMRRRSSAAAALIQARFPTTARQVMQRIDLPRITPHPAGSLVGAARSMPLAAVSSDSIP